MNSLKLDIEIPCPSEVTMDFVKTYYESVARCYGPEWCGDCRHFLDDRCTKKHRPRIYQMQFGPKDHVFIRKNCKDWDMHESDGLDTSGIESGVRKVLDCNYQQYC